jgi:hypothetical protein
MTSKMPPVPPENRSPKGPGDNAPQAQQASSDPGNPQKANPDKIGQAGNSKVNTTHQGYQQDR